MLWIRAGAYGRDETRSRLLVIVREGPTLDFQAASWPLDPRRSGSAGVVERGAARRTGLGPAELLDRLWCRGGGSDRLRRVGVDHGLRLSPRGRL
jgi:hypothetical protein